MGSILKKTAWHTAIYSFGNLAAKLTGFLLLPLYAQHLTAAEYGVFGLLETIWQLLIAMLSLSIPTAIMRWCSDDKNFQSKKTIVSTAIFSLLLILFSFNILSLPFLEHLSYAFFETSEYKNFLLLVFISLSFDILNLLVLNLIRLEEKPFQYIILNVVKLTVILLLNIYLIAYKGYGVLGMILGQLIGNVIFSIGSVYILLKYISFRFSKTLFREMISYGFPLIFTNVSAIVLSIGDRFFIKHFLSFEDLGIYSLGYKIGGIINVFIVQSFQLGFLPIAYKMYNQPDAKYFFQKVLDYFVVVLVLSTLLLSAFSKELITLLSPENSKFREAHVVVPLIAFSFIIKGVQYFFSLGLHYVKKTSYNAWIVIISSGVSIGLNYYLIPKLGIIGSAVSINIATLLMAILYYYFSQKMYYIPYNFKKITLTVSISVMAYMICNYIDTINISMSLYFKFFIIFIVLVSFQLFRIINFLQVKDIITKIK